MPVSYDKNANYKALIDEAIAAGDYKAAAQYEQQRNAKIAGEGMTQYQQTHNLGSAYDASHMTNSELGAAYNARQAAQASGDWSSSHDFVESQRKKYGYSGGADGSQYVPIEKTKQTPAYVNQYQDQIDSLTQKLLDADKEQFTYQDAPAFVSRYQDQIDALSKEILGRGEFSYDPEQDPAYQQYRHSYTSGGQRAMQDTMGQLAARTGGLASSYAGSAAQQTYDNYMGALANKIPELQQLAYQMYLDEWNGKRSELSTLQGLEQSDYDRYLTELGQYNADRSMAYSTYRDQQSDLWRALNSLAELEQTGYNRYRDQIADDRYAGERDYSRAVYADERDYNRAVYADERDYNRAVYAGERDYNRGIYAGETDYDRKLQRAKQLAETGDFSGYLDLGYSDEEIARMQAAFMLRHPELPALYRYGY